MRKLLLIVSASLIGFGALLFITSKTALAPSNTTSNETASPNPTTIEPGFNKSLYSVKDASSLWVIVNKSNMLNPVNYKPTNLTIPQVPQRVPGNESMQLNNFAASALEEMFDAAKKSGINLMLASGYRSYEYQVGLYNGYVRAQGQVKADTISARPGHSEHQTGLAADIEPLSRQCELNICFASTPEGKWLAANSYKYGYIIRYTADKVAVTGYEFEPWHVRYVGKLLASELVKQNVYTLEEFFDVSGGTSY